MKLQRDFADNLCYRQKFYKLKKESEALYSGNAAAPNTPAPKKAAAKPKSTGKASVTSSVKKRKLDADGAMEEELVDTPTKPSKSVDDGDGGDVEV